MLMMAVVVSLLSNIGDTPTVRVSPIGYMTIAACEAWQKTMSEVETPIVDPIENRILKARFYQCLVVDGDSELKSLQDAIAAEARQ